MESKQPWIISPDPGRQCGVAIWSPEGRRYRLFQYGLIRATGQRATIIIHDIVKEILLYSKGNMKIHCEEQYIKQDIKKGDKTLSLQGNRLVSLVINRARWQVIAEIYGIEFETVMAQTWQTKILRVSKFAKRDQRKKAAQKLIEHAFKINVTLDEADSICIGLYAIIKVSEQDKTIYKPDQNSALSKGLRWK